MNLRRMRNFDVADSYVIELMQYFSKYELCVTNVQFKPKTELLEAQ